MASKLLKGLVNIRGLGISWARTPIAKLLSFLKKT
jgi:hypothetical protein